VLDDRPVRAQTRTVRRELEDVVASLAGKDEVSLDELADAIGPRAVSFDDVDALMRALEDAGTRIRAPMGGDGEERLRVVLPAARALRAELGRAPTVDEIALRTSLDRAVVRRALFLAQVIAR
jgi:hypothetical protein